MSNSKRRRSILGAIAAVLLISAGAVAYWTVGGSGTGSGAAAGGTTAVVVNQTTTLSAMYPGDSPQTLSGTFTNTSAGPVYVGTVTASISSVTKAAGAPAGTCDATDFTLADAAMAVNTQVAVGTGVGAWTGATIQFNNKATNQDACKGATVSLSYAVS